MNQDPRNHIHKKQERPAGDINVLVRQIKKKNTTQQPTSGMLNDLLVILRTLIYVFKEKEEKRPNISMKILTFG